MTKEKIFEDLKTMKQADIARKYNVSPTYISLLVKEKEIEEKLKECKKYKFFHNTITDLAKRGAFIAYKSKMTKEEIKLWESL